MAISKIQSESMNLADDYTFTGALSAGGGLDKFHVYKTNTQNMTASSGGGSVPSMQIVTFNSVTNNSGNVINPDGLFANNKFTATSASAGTYFIYYQVYWYAYDAYGNNNLFPIDGYGEIHKNGSAITRDFAAGSRQFFSNFNAVYNNAVSKSATVRGYSIITLANTDYLEIKVTSLFNGTGSYTQIQGANNQVYFGGFRLGSV